MSPNHRRQFGNTGEDLAVSYFLDRGFQVITRNWLCRWGEIDLIIERGGVTHFVEVKIRRSVTYGYPEESITRFKLRKLARAIETYLRDTPYPPSRYQVDALAITALPGTQPEFHYVEFIA